MIVRLIPLGSLFDNALINSINRRILIVVHHRAALQQQLAVRI